MKDQCSSEFDILSTLQVRTERGILPESDARQAEATLRRAVAAVEADNLTQAQSILEERIEIEQELLCQVIAFQKLYPP